MLKKLKSSGRGKGGYFSFAIVHSDNSFSSLPVKQRHGLCKNYVAASRLPERINCRGYGGYLSATRSNIPAIRKEK